MAATIVHFGEDVTFRLPVLRSAGYTVEACDSFDCLSGLLSTETQVVAVEEACPTLLRRAATLTRTHSRASLVLFCNEPTLVERDGFDLVMPSHTHPEVWLKQFAELLNRSRAMQAEAQILRSESAEVRAQSQQLRKQSIELRTTKLNDPWAIPGGNKRGSLEVRSQALCPTHTEAAGSDPGASGRMNQSSDVPERVW